MKRILVPIGCRSDEGLSVPVIKRLKAAGFDVGVLQLFPQDFLKSYAATDDWFDEHGRPDLMFITGDRVEMCAAAAAAFHNKVKIAHFYAGVVNDPITTFDDVDRHCITLWSDIQFVENEEAKQTIYGDDETYDGTVYFGLLHAICKEANCHIVGISHLDDLDVDLSLVPIGEGGYYAPYDLILWNRPPITPYEELQKDMDDIANGTCGDRGPGLITIQIGGNPDGNDLLIEDEGNSCPHIFYDNLPRPQFLGLLKNCQRFITNSSAAIYEAPHFLKPEQIVMVGDRNRNRPRGPFKTGASDRIVEILREYLK